MHSAADAAANKAQAVPNNCQDARVNSLESGPQMSIRAATRPSAIATNATRTDHRLILDSVSSFTVRSNVRVERRAASWRVRSRMMGWTPPALCAASSCQADTSRGVASAKPQNRRSPSHQSSLGRLPLATSRVTHAIMGEPIAVGSVHAHGDRTPRVPVRLSQLTTSSAVHMAM